MIEGAEESGGSDHSYDNFGKSARMCSKKCPLVPVPPKAKRTKDTIHFSGIMDKTQKIIINAVHQDVKF